MIDLDPNHPALIQGRRHSREVMEAAARAVRQAQEAKTADAASTLSTALQMVISSALVDGFAPREAYAALAGALAWAVCRLPSDERLGVRGASGFVCVLLALVGLVIGVLGFKRGGDALGVAFERGGVSWAVGAAWGVAAYGGCLFSVLTGVWWFAGGRLP
jgi:hypothetical protein